MPPVPAPPDPLPAPPAPIKLTSVSAVASLAPDVASAFSPAFSPSFSPLWPPVPAAPSSDVRAPTSPRNVSAPPQSRPVTLIAVKSRATERPFRTAAFMRYLQPRLLLTGGQ